MTGTLDIRLRDAAAVLRESMARLAEADDVEALHQARVALRRARSACWFFAPLEDPDRMAALREDLRWAARGLAQARALDAALPRLADGAVKAWAEGARRGAYAAARRMLGSPRFAMLVEAMSAGSGADEETDAAIATAMDAHVPRRLDRALRLLRRAARRLDPERPATLHAVRLAAKRLRYAVECAAALGKGDRGRRGKRERTRGRTPERMLRRLERLQLLTGELCDRYATAELLGEIGLPPETIARAMQHDGRADAAVHAKIRVRLRKLLRKRPYWR